MFSVTVGGYHERTTSLFEPAALPPKSQQETVAGPVDELDPMRGGSGGQRKADSSGQIGKVRDPTWKLAELILGK